MSSGNTIVTLRLDDLNGNRSVRDSSDSGVAIAVAVADAREELRRGGPPTQPMRVVDDEPDDVPRLSFDDSITQMDAAFDALLRDMESSLEDHRVGVVAEEFDSDGDSVRRELAQNLKTTFGSRYPDGIYDRLAADIYAFFALKFALLPRLSYTDTRAAETETANRAVAGA